MAKKLTMKERADYAQRIKDSCRDDLYNYQDFVLGCVESHVLANWSDEELKEWFSEGKNSEG